MAKDGAIHQALGFHNLEDLNKTTMRLAQTTENLIEIREQLLLKMAEQVRRSSQRTDCYYCVWQFNDKNGRVRPTSRRSHTAAGCLLTVSEHDG